MLDDKESITVNTIEEEELRKIISRLDECIPKDGAIVKLAQYGGGPDEGMIVGNKRGYLRLGVEFLKGAIAEPTRNSKGDEKVIPVDLEYMIQSGSSINFDWFERLEDIEPDIIRKPPTLLLKLLPSFIFTIIIGILVLAIIGLVAIINY
jgi:hypothetical protein